MNDNNNDKLIVEHDGNGVVKLILNRQEVNNALDSELINQLNNTLKSLKNDDTRVIQIRSNGKHFSAGADLNWMKQARFLGRKENYKDAMKLAKLLKRIDRFPAPVITVVQGAAYGGALGLIAASDITLASDSSCFCFSEVRLGLIPAVISPYVLNTMGVRQAKRYFLTGEVMSAEKARELGFAHEIYPLDQLEERVKQVTEFLLMNGPEAQKQAKKLIREIKGKPVDDDLMGLTAKRIADIRVSDEAQEGLEAFLEKRPPGWREL
ncbi:enoyl-CoA hydratase-related protein [Endozoicomonas sp. Mp262]|uniref:enoyl-CoA hydratase-related protein n=1 Tax=Endozoicomonas sp. Mp262 TaxID=2919499 RepID=UPI0021E0485D